ncbi:MAG TPA: DUF4149 domain-containing protein [Pyrinomonadaceae bacterium]|nr:DUF4149 domain-containing protein [Pyrinomonadaceae bacterium]
MKFFSDIRLLVLAIWLGAAVFFIGVAQAAFAVLPQRELAGAVVNRTLAILNFSGMAISVFLILTSMLATSRISKLWLWVERFLLLVIAAACAVGQFVIGLWLASVRAQIGKPIDDVPLDDPLRIQFNMLHEYSVWVLFAGMVAALIAFFIIANRKFSSAPAKAEKDNIYDFSKEFKV